MGIIVRFTRAHARASSSSPTSGLRAANATNVSAFSPALTATPVAKIGDHHSAGTLSRCAHLVTVGTLAPMSDAIASRESQRAMSSRKDVICSAMAKLIGPIVLKRKANLSLDGKLSLGHTVQMSEQDTETQFKQLFTERVKAARESQGLTQGQVAKALGIPQDRYKQYEGRSYLPPHFYERFCIVCRADLVWLMTGQGQKPLKAIQLVDEPEPIARPKRRRSQKAA